MQGRFGSKLGLGCLLNCVGKQVLNGGIPHRTTQTHELDLSVSQALASSSCTFPLFFPCPLNMSPYQNPVFGPQSGYFQCWGHRAAKGGFFKAT